ncbi:peptidase M23-like protein [Labedella gwakjiensis]|uniref:M23 family metallopeptidase n=1 Tax=Labedella gwakjiensis TaxID=390269 RepID=A0A2P8H155_9MICO|nr:M23 family metallopeptidase [Labedella gwakjiensis]PSL39946.1 peptidase M23-like protein [Labedella gwakjiensis]RUQ85694.1 M23 family metallopeptidase [Labedella gwakjiensis]
MTHSEPLATPHLSRRNIVLGASALAASALLADIFGPFPSAPARAAEPEWYFPFMTRYSIRSDFGPRASPCAGCSSFHRGLDYSPGRNTQIYAAAAGTIVWRRDDLNYGQFEANSFGNCLTIDHGDGFQTVYAHLERGTLAPLGEIAAGAPIARVGHNGSSTGPHLHIEVRQNGVSIDPEPKIQLAPLASAVPEQSDLERLDMMMITCNAAYKNVTKHYTAIVGFKSLHHLTALERDSLIKHGKMTQRTMTPAEFEAILTALQIPITAAVAGANYDGGK